MTDWKNRDNKATARSLAVSKKKWQSFLSLCGPEMLCYKEALPNKSREAVALLVEYENEYQKRIGAQILGSKGTRLHPGRLEECSLGCPVDLAYIDLCGNITVELLNWIRHTLRPNIMDGADISFTFLFQRRGNKFRDAEFKRLDSLYPIRINELIQKYGWLKNEAHRSFVAHYIVLLEELLIDKKWEDVRVYPYADTGNKMYLLKLCSVSRQEKKMSKTASTTTLANRILNAKTPGQKAAATRSRKAYVAERVEQGFDGTQVNAGIESWVTRLKNARKRK